MRVLRAIFGEDIRKTGFSAMQIDGMFDAHELGISLVSSFQGSIAPPQEA